MIFVTLGTHELSFERLLNEIEKLNIEEEVIIQSGNTKFSSKKYKVYQFLDKEEFEYYINKSDVVICHSGIGTILNALKLNKRIIVAPRLSKYNEHNDDHQLEIGEKFEKDNYLLLYRENDDLKKLIDKCKVKRFNKYIFDNSRLVNFIDLYLKKL